jgi:hypothetical protein
VLAERSSGGTHQGAFARGTTDRDQRRAGTEDLIGMQVSSAEVTVSYVMRAGPVADESFIASSGATVLLPHPLPQR